MGAAGTDEEYRINVVEGSAFGRDDEVEMDVTERCIKRAAAIVTDRFRVTW